MRANREDTAVVRTVAAGRPHYDGLAIALHWLTVILVLAQFVLAETWGWVALPTKHEMIVLHMSFGMLLAAVIVVRMTWRSIPGHRMPPAVSGWMEIASEVVHYLLYAMLVAEAVLGFLLRWSGNESMSFFGLEISPPFAPFSKPAHELMRVFHHWNGRAIVLLAAGHAAAALYHHFVLRDRVLLRMLPLSAR